MPTLLRPTTLWCVSPSDLIVPFLFAIFIISLTPFVEQPHRDRQSMISKMCEWNAKDVVDVRQERGIHFYIVKWPWSERLQQTAIVCVETPKFGPSQDSYSWNRAKAIVILIMRGERKPRTESEKIVDIQTACLQDYLKIEIKSKQETLKSNPRKTCSDRPSGVSKFEILRCQSLEFDAETARSKRTKEVHTQYKNLIDAL
jgi:hypothetical protein